MLIDNAIPVIDPSVKHVGVSKLRELNATKLREETTEGTFVIQENDTPLAVLLSYEKYLIIQEQMQAVMNTLDLLCDADEVNSLMVGLREAAEGKSRSLADIRADLAKKKRKG